MDRIEIALASDRNYFDGLFVTATSIASHASGDCKLVFHVLDGGISQEDRQLLTSALGRLHGNCIVISHVIDESIFSKFPTWAGNGRMAYARLLLPSLLQDIDYVIYVDCDMIWTRDILLLWRQRRDDISIQAVHENWSEMLDKEEAWFLKRDIDFDRSRYFISGMCLFNLSKFRDFDLQARSLAFLTKYSDVQWVDQTVLNALFAHSPQLENLPVYWACTNWLMTSETLKSDGKGVVVHFAGNAPWKSLRLNPILNNLTLAWFRQDALGRQCSVWASLRRYYSPLKIVVSRMIFLCCSLPCLGRIILFVLLLMRGKLSSYSSLLPFIARFSV